MGSGRQSKRFELPIPLKIRVVDSPAPAMATATCSNVSSRGVYFWTDFPFLVSERVEVSLAMPKEVVGAPARDWLCYGRVVRTESRRNEGNVGVAILLRDSAKRRSRAKSDERPRKEPAVIR
jgi:PilZ domain